MWRYGGDGWGWEVRPTPSGVVMSHPSVLATISPPQPYCAPVSHNLCLDASRLGLDLRSLMPHYGLLLVLVRNGLFQQGLVRLCLADGRHLRLPLGSARSNTQHMLEPCAHSLSLLRLRYPLSGGAGSMGRCAHVRLLHDLFLQAGLGAHELTASGFQLVLRTTRIQRTGQQLTRSHAYARTQTLVRGAPLLSNSVEAHPPRDPPLPWHTSTL